MAAYEHNCTSQRSNKTMKNGKSKQGESGVDEYRQFSNALSKILTVSHSELATKIQAAKRPSRPAGKSKRVTSSRASSETVN
jgi:hypothetical protein